MAQVKRWPRFVAVSLAQRIGGALSTARVVFQSDAHSLLLLDPADTTLELQRAAATHVEAQFDRRAYGLGQTGAYKHPVRA